MPSAQDEEFLRFAVARGHITEDQAAEASAALREIEQLGGQATAPQMLQRRGLLDERQVGLVHQAIAASKKATRVPRELAGFELLEKIGQGAMGSVFRARQKELDRVVALKVLSPRLARNEQFVARFLREARAAGRLNHPNIVAAIDVGEDQGFYFFAMEYVDGEPLSRLIARQGALPEARALHIAAEVARALDHAFQKDLIHRDIKPDNIMITRDDRVRVTDFGLAKALGADAPGDGDRFLGTPAYVAPEQVRSEPDIDCRADIFSLGVTLYQMLTGELPFQGANPMAVAAAVCGEPLPSLRKRCPDIRQATVRAVEKMTAKDPADRYATPADAVAALEAAAAAPRIKPRAPSEAIQARRRSRRRRKLVGAIVTLVLILAANAVIFIFFSKDLFRGDRDEADAQAAEDGPEPDADAGDGPSPTGSVREEARRLLGDLDQALADARAYARDHPDDYVGQIERYREALRYREMLRDFPAAERQRLPAELLRRVDQVEQTLADLEQKADEAAAAQLQRLNAQVDELFAQGQFAQGLHLLETFPQGLRTAAAVEKLEAYRSHYRQRAAEQFEEIDQRATKLIQQGHLDQARGIYLEAKQWGVPQVSRRAEEQLAAIEELVAKQADQRFQQARAAYRQVAKETLDLLAAGDYEAAHKLVDTRKVDPQVAPVRERFDGLQHLVRTAEEVWGRVLGGIRKLDRGDTVRLDGIGWTFVGLDDGILRLRMGKAERGLSLAQLKPSHARLFLGQSPGWEPRFRVKFALYLLAQGHDEAARAELGKAKAAGADVAQAEDLLQRFAPTPCAQCQGQGTVDCPRCEGTGFINVQVVPCQACGGKGWTRCTRCGGRGWKTCANCGGTGRAPGPCSYCGGDGRVDCPYCTNGRATCKRCGGKGKLTRGEPCPRCKGEKRIPCPTCDGRGEIPPPDLPPPAP
ncbi:MAG: protein kinase domain-containing protein [Candidatus Brocadiia bacterium]